jgi:hypothetical protein
VTIRGFSSNPGAVFSGGIDASGSAAIDRFSVETGDAGSLHFQITSFTGTVQTICFTNPEATRGASLEISVADSTATNPQFAIRSLSFVSDPATTLTDWAGSYGLTGPDAGENANTDEDWSSLLFEYASNLDPSMADTHVLIPGTGNSGLPSTRMVEAGSDARLKVEYLRRKNDPNLRYVVEFGSDLTNSSADGWAEATEIEEVTYIDEIWDRVAVEDSKAVATSTRRFGRVRIVLSDAP